VKLSREVPVVFPAAMGTRCSLRSATAHI